MCVSVCMCVVCVHVCVHVHFLHLCGGVISRLYMLLKKEIIHLEPIVFFDLVQNSGRSGMGHS